MKTEHACRCVPRGVCSWGDKFAIRSVYGQISVLYERTKIDERRVIDMRSLWKIAGIRD